MWLSSFVHTRFVPLGLADDLRRRPSNDNQCHQNLPAISVSVSRYGEMIADHDKDNWNRHESIVLGSQLGLPSERRIKLCAGRSRGNHLALGWKYAEPHVGRHDGS